MLLKVFGKGSENAFFQKRFSDNSKTKKSQTKKFKSKNPKNLKFKKIFINPIADGIVDNFFARHNFPPQNFSERG
jgi:hypothetical protein